MLIDLTHGDVRLDIDVRARCPGATYCLLALGRVAHDIKENDREWVMSSRVLNFDLHAGPAKVDAWVGTGEDPLDVWFIGPITLKREWFGDWFLFFFLRSTTEGEVDVRATPASSVVQEQSGSPTHVVFARDFEAAVHVLAGVGGTGALYEKGLSTRDGFLGFFTPGLETVGGGYETPTSEAWCSLCAPRATMSGPPGDYRFLVTSRTPLLDGDGPVMAWADVPTLVESIPSQAELVLLPSLE